MGLETKQGQIVFGELGLRSTDRSILGVVPDREGSLGIGKSRVLG